MEDKDRHRIDWKRIYALPYNYEYFDKDVLEVREELGLPAEGISNQKEAVDWIARPPQDYRATFPKTASSPFMEYLAERHPVFGKALYLAERYRLPPRMCMSIGMYIVTGVKTM